MQGWDTNAFRDRLPEDGLGHHECYDLGSETHTFPCHCCRWTCLTLTPLPWPCMPKWMQWRMAGEQQMMASVPHEERIFETKSTKHRRLQTPSGMALMSTTAANIALSWLTFIEQAEKGARGDVATKKVIQLLSSERICNLVEHANAWISPRRDKGWDGAQGTGHGVPHIPQHPVAAQRYFADGRVAALQALCNRIKSWIMGEETLFFELGPNVSAPTKMMPVDMQ